MYKEYLIRYKIDRAGTFGVAVVVAKTIRSANEYLQRWGKYNSDNFTYLILETALINSTDTYYTEAILEEISTGPGYSAYESAKKYGFKGTEKEWLATLKGEQGPKGEPGPPGPPGSGGDSSKVERLTEEEYNELVANGQIDQNSIYLIVLNDDPIALYIGTTLIAQREEGSKGFTYNFPIIF